MKKVAGMLVCVLFVLLAGAADALGEAWVRMPSELKIIEAEAFLNVPIEYLEIPEGTLRIESKAFAGCGIRQVVLPDSLEYVAPDAFGEVGDLWVSASAGSCGDVWARENYAIPVTGLGTEYHTQEEIRAFIAAHPAVTQREETFRRAPTGGAHSDGPYSAGLLSEESIQNALNMLNQLRYIAGVNADVVNDPAWEEAMAACALVNGLNGTITHFPGRPSELSDPQYDQLYWDGYACANMSNLSSGYECLADALLGCIYDGGSNISTVGHRRWILNPALGKVAFGYYTNRYWRSKYFSGMRILDESGSGTQRPVAWPARLTPLTHFTKVKMHPWSLSFGRWLNETSIAVYLECVTDGREWTFSTQQADGEFYVNNDNCGMPGCVIFLPEDIGWISEGDVFRVSVEDKLQRTVVQYTVTFFDP